MIWYLVSLIIVWVFKFIYLKFNDPVGKNDLLFKKNIGAIFKRKNLELHKTKTKKGIISYIKK